MKRAHFALIVAALAVYLLKGSHTTIDLGPVLGVVVTYDGSPLPTCVRGLEPDAPCVDR